MNEKLLKLLNAINEKKTLVQSLAEEGKLDEAEEEKTELQNMQKKFDLLKDVVDAPAQNKDDPDLNGLENKGENTTKMKPAKDGPKDSTQEFANALRYGLKNQLNEGTGENGGYVVPEDIQTRINQYKTAEFSMLALVDTEQVRTDKGARTFQKRATLTRFVETEEGGAIPAMAEPEFERITYAIKDYTGFLPVTNDLLHDTDQNFTAVITGWIARNSIATANRLILEKLQEKKAVALTGIADIKKALNVTLGQAYKPTAVIVTNDDGLNYLDTLEDKTGRPLLNPDPTAPANLQLRSGATVIPIKVIPNAVLATKTNKIPFLIGDMKEAIKYFDRQSTEILASDVAAVGSVNAFANNLTLFRAIEREDVQMKDADAFVNGYITVTDTAKAGA